MRLLDSFNGMEEACRELYRDSVGTQYKFIHNSLSIPAAVEIYNKYSKNGALDVELAKKTLLKFIMSTESSGDGSGNMSFSEEFKNLAKDAGRFQLEYDERMKISVEPGKAEVTFTSLLFIIYKYESKFKKDEAVIGYALQEAGFNWKAFEKEMNGKKSDLSVLEEMCVNLNTLAKEGRIDKVIGRDDEILQVIEVLGKRNKNNPLLIGKAGVGKTAIAEGIALKIVEGDVPDTIKNAVIYNLQVSHIVSGTKFRGEFEEKMKKLVSQVELLIKEGEVYPVIFIDEIHTIVGTGSTGGSGLDFANIIKPAIARGRFPVVGATTDREFKKFMEQDGALRRRFHKITIEEPSRDKTVEILMNAKRYYEAKHGLTYTKEAIEKAVDLSIKHIHDNALPDKSLDLIDYTGSMYKIKKAVVVDIPEIEEGLAKQRQISLKAIREQDKKEEYKPMAPEIKKVLFGQDHAVDQVCETLEVSLAGLNEEDKPLGSFLFAGPTGVGKTELAKTVANLMGAHLIRLDMSEYQLEHSTTKLLGAPPSYVGYDDGSVLEEISKHPYCVLLLDEMEKAHPKVQEIFLQAMDNAVVTDSRNNKIVFRNSLIIMTSNVGAREAAKNVLGLTKEHETSIQGNRRVDALNKFFSPEFRGRLSGIIQFNSINETVIGSIVDRLVKDLNDTKFKAKGVVLELTEEGKKFVIKNGYNATLGARPMKNFIDANIKKEIAQSILKGDILKGKKYVTVDSDGEKLTYEYSESKTEKVLAEA